MRWQWLGVLLLPALGWAAEPCSVQSKVGDSCDLPITALRPTQGGVGLLQVEDEVAKLGKATPKQLAKIIKKKEIPVVISPDQQYWLVDRHHLSRALWQLGVTEVRVRLVGRIKDRHCFWRQMQDNHWAWLQDQQGRPLDPAALPAEVSALPDYPYRSLAGMLEDAGYIDKPSPGYFFEFTWANWLGQKMAWAPVQRDNLAEMLSRARRLACSHEASALPGYPGKSCRK